MIRTSRTIRIGKHTIGDGHPVFIICEGGVTNYGQYALAKKQIDAAVAAKADAIKFQLWNTASLVSKVSAQKYQKKLGYNWYTRLKSRELSFTNLKKLFAYAQKKHITCFASPHDEESVDKLVALGVDCIKVGSGEAHNHRFLSHVASKKIPVIISFGMHTPKEIQSSVRLLVSRGTPSVIPLHCTTEYPTKPQHAALRQIYELQHMVTGPVGYSDHTVGYHVPLAAIAMGIKVMEKHITFDKSDPRSLDNPGALLSDEFITFVSAARDVEASMVFRDLSTKKSLNKSRLWAGQSIVAARKITRGENITESHILFKRPLIGGLGPEQLNHIIGRRAKQHIAPDEQITLRNTY
ncbi:MAG: N-acetylneuraminate synthase family protein [Patescibacteria group bacterium]